ncbi:MAG: hypothetical protein PHT94_05060 [Candidatus Nanoarchaeia archaeon]|nr:hypothetical protein [Candidatus Nanoarchaeia archaeon]
MTIITTPQIKINSTIKIKENITNFIAKINIPPPRKKLSILSIIFHHPFRIDKGSKLLALLPYLTYI